MQIIAGEKEIYSLIDKVWNDKKAVTAGTDLKSNKMNTRQDIIRKLIQIENWDKQRCLKIEVLNEQNKHAMLGLSTYLNLLKIVGF